MNSQPIRSLLVAMLFAFAALARAQAVAPHAIDIPPWFSETLLEFPEEVREAAAQGKRLMVYFGQDGCPYCTALMQTNFSQRSIVEKTRQRFVAVALNIWGDREVVWTDGRARSEKNLARDLRVQFTPTLLFLDEKGEVIVRLNGYYPPHRFEAALEYAAGRVARGVRFDEYMKGAVKESASASLHDEPFFLKPPHDLRRVSGRKPLAVLFETPYCSGCDELHRDGFRRPDVLGLIKKFDVARFALSDRSEIVTPSGRRSTAEAYARELQIAYTPTIVFFAGADGAEVLRIDAYLRPFHLASAFDYVASGAYRREPSFQRFIQARAERMRERGETVELWK